MKGRTAVRVRTKARVGIMFTRKGLEVLSRRGLENLCWGLYKVLTRRTTAVMLTASESAVQTQKIIA